MMAASTANSSVAIVFQTAAPSACLFCLTLQRTKNFQQGTDLRRKERVL